jgi:hypothetical protein
MLILVHIEAFLVEINKVSIKHYHIRNLKLLNFVKPIQTKLELIQKLLNPLIKKDETQNNNYIPPLLPSALRLAVNLKTRWLIKEISRL